MGEGIGDHLTQHAFGAAVREAFDVGVERDQALEAFQHVRQGPRAVGGQLRLRWV